MQKTNLNIRSSYKRYSKEMENPVELKPFLQVAHGYMDFLIKKVIEGEEVTMPARLGTLFIQGVKKKLTFKNNSLYFCTN